MRDDCRDFILPFGKHKGERLDDVPLDYLDWAVGAFDPGRVRDAIETYLNSDVIRRELGRESP